MSSPAQLDCVLHLLTLHNRGFRNTWRFQVTVTWQLFHRFCLLSETKQVRCLVSLNQLLLNRGNLYRYVIMAVRWAVNICSVTLKGFHVRTPIFFCAIAWKRELNAIQEAHIKFLLFNGYSTLSYHTLYLRCKWHALYTVLCDYSNTVRLWWLHNILFYKIQFDTESWLVVVLPLLARCEGMTRLNVEWFLTTNNGYCILSTILSRSAPLPPDTDTCISASWSSTFTEPTLFQVQPQQDTGKHSLTLSNRPKMTPRGSFFNYTRGLRIELTVFFETCSTISCGETQLFKKF